MKFFHIYYFPTRKKCMAKPAIFVHDLARKFVRNQPTILVHLLTQEFAVEFIVRIIINDSHK